MRRLAWLVLGMFLAVGGPAAAQQTGPVKAVGSVDLKDAAGDMGALEGF